MRRIPLWLTVVPLVVAGAVYWHFWSGWRDELRADLAAVMPGEAAAIGGFPYRMEADIARPRYALAGPVRLDLTAARAVVNRNPWQRDLSVVRADRPVVTIAVAGQPAADVHAAAATSASSVRLGAGGIGRLSTVFTGLSAATGLFAAPIAAATFEVHLRETRARSNEAWSATPPQQAQVVLAGRGVRFGAGAPLGLDLDAGITATARLTSYAAWADGGTVEIRSAVLTDATGEVARLAASIVPAATMLRVTGTVTTVCPGVVRAAVDGTPPPARELRLRNPVRLAFGGTPGFFVLAPLPNDAPTAVRGQLPPCPRLD